MKRIWTMLAVLGLLVSSAATSVAAPKHSATGPRTVLVRYDAPSAYFTCVRCPEEHARSRETHVSVEIIDEVSGSGHVDVVWEDGFITVCGKTTEPQPIPPKSSLTIYPWAHPGPDCPTSLSTRGTVKLTFTSAP